MWFDKDEHTRVWVSPEELAALEKRIDAERARWLEEAGVSFHDRWLQAELQDPEFREEFERERAKARNS